ncbi:carbohydrate kinase family protein [Streptomyces sp. SID12488]|uniref:carbohydrate kinase family protein n=1 Tax=Streptomyces sp. SID12488 TaxID=2706040 RepID=UPI0013D97E57|nr:carbohydrate kinase family protein [Streptomyces sp. SID12488]NEA63750.1 carbohydrate kinase family protein [Streptomyces sp. SID12488]
MRIAVTGSIATDHLTVFPGRFTEQLIADRLDTVSLSFLVDDLEVRRGGVAANISFGLGLLGLTPVLVGAAGTDFAEYDVWLRVHGVDTGSVKVSRTRHTARFMCTTDADQNQIAVFYAGAMSEARDIALSDVAARVGGLDLVVVAPDDPAAMARHTAECRALGIARVADPSQQLARLIGDEARQLVDGAQLLFTNEYEAALLQERTGWTEKQVLDRVGTWIVTRGGSGTTVRAGGATALTVPAVPTERIADPTGGGDAFRAGYLAGLGRGLSPERSAQVGSALATTVLETIGTQEYKLVPAEFSTRVADAYGPVAAAEIAARVVGRG